MNENENEEQGTLYEAGRVVVQARAIVGVVNAILDSLPIEVRTAVLDDARLALATDTGALKILEAGLHIERHSLTKGDRVDG